MHNSLKTTIHNIIKWFMYNEKKKKKNMNQLNELHTYANDFHIKNIINCLILSTNLMRIGWILKLYDDHPYWIPFILSL